MDNALPTSHLRCKDPAQDHTALTPPAWTQYLVQRVTCGGERVTCALILIQFHFPLRSQISQLVVFLGIRKRALLTCEVEVNLMLIMRWNVMVTRRQMTVSPATQEKASVERVWPPCLQRELAPHHLLKLRGGLVSCVSARGPRLTQRPRGALSPLPALSRVFVLHTPQTLPSLIFRRRLSGE